MGRTNKIAYAYLMYKKNKVLSEVATKRLNVIKEFTELGSGFSVAVRDLSIRGAGDILGSEQSGFIDSVGIDLYIKMLNEEINKINGIETEEEQDITPLLNVSTHIEDSYVDSDELKVIIHKKINEIDNYEKLIKVKNEIEDRFGKISEEIDIYIHEELFDILARQKHVEKVNQNKTNVEMIFSREESVKIKKDDVFMKAYEISRMFRFKYSGNKFVIMLDTIKLEKHWLFYLIELLEQI